MCKPWQEDRVHSGFGEEFGFSLQLDCMWGPSRSGENEMIHFELLP